MRTRLRDAGLVKREFWILPENATALRGIEKALRQPFLGERIKLEAFMTENINWTINSLHKALSGAGGRVQWRDCPDPSAENAEQSIKLNMDPNSATCRSTWRCPVTRSWWDATLVEVSRVKDPAVFNSLVLRQPRPVPAVLRGHRAGRRRHRGLLHVRRAERGFHDHRDRPGNLHPGRKRDPCGGSVRRTTSTFNEVPRSFRWSIWKESHYPPFVVAFPRWVRPSSMPTPFVSSSRNSATPKMQ